MAFTDHKHKERARQIAKEFILENTGRQKAGAPICILTNGCKDSFPTFEKPIIDQSPYGSINVSYDNDKKTFPINKNAAPFNTLVFPKNIFGKTALCVPQKLLNTYPILDPHCINDITVWEHAPRSKQLTIDAAWIDAMITRSHSTAKKIAVLLSKGCTIDKYKKAIALSTIRQHSIIDKDKFETLLSQELKERGLEYESWGWNKIKGANSPIMLDMFLFTVLNERY